MQSETEVFIHVK